MSEKKRTDWSYRIKMFNLKIPVDSFPVDESDFEQYLLFLELVRQSQSTSVAFGTAGSKDYQEIRLSYTGDAFYLEITYPMDDFGWDHPLILANDSLTLAEAEEVLRSLLVDGTDQTEIITNHFHEISSSIYEEKN